MAVQSLAVRYRPKVWGDVVEQPSTIILTNQLNTGTIQHAYLFTGPAGTGKTTCARIFANEINKGVGVPIEIDAASNNGVDGVRQIIEESKKRALSGEYKVYILDECHSLTDQSWQAFLKLLEEPPKYTVFIFCTTDPQKIPQTIMSRVQRFPFNRISLEGIISRLNYIVEKEGLKRRVQKEAIEYIAKSANGGMRTAITSLEKCLACGDIITIQQVVDVLGVSDYPKMFKLLRSLISADTETSIEVIESVYNSGADIYQFVRSFNFFLVEVCKYYIGGCNKFEYTDIPPTEDNKRELEGFDFDSVKIVLSFFNDVAVSLKWETEPRKLLEALLIAR